MNKDLVQMNLDVGVWQIRIKKVLVQSVDIWDLKVYERQNKVNLKEDMEVIYNNVVEEHLHILYLVT